MLQLRMKRLLVIGTFMLSPFANSETMAIVNGTSIDKKELDQMANTIVQHGQAKDTPALREKLKNILIDRELILQEAKTRGLDKTDEVRRRLNEARNEILSAALFADIIKQSPVTEAQIKARYDEWASKRKGQQEVHVQQIVTSSEQNAQKVIADLKKGANFTNLAKSQSIDPNAKQTGGDMGWGNLSEMDPVLADALKTLKPGQYSQKPYQAGTTWHVFKLEAIRDAKVPELDQVRNQVVQQLQEEKIADFVSNLRKKAKVENK